MAISVDPYQTALIGAACSGSTLFASILNSSVMLGNYLQQTTSADDMFRCILFLGPLRVNMNSCIKSATHAFNSHVSMSTNPCINKVIHEGLDGGGLVFTIH